MLKSETIAMRLKRLSNLIFTLVLMCVQACASVTDQSQTASVPADIGGQWSGTSVASCIPFQTASGSDSTLIRVQLSDGTSCLFKGIFEKAEVKGVYSCYGGAAVIEQGSWR